jgi:hypothetical protein
LAGPPADFLNAAPIGLSENRTSPKESFSTSGNGRWRQISLTNEPPPLDPLENEIGQNRKQPISA